MTRNEAIAVLYEASGCQLFEIELACHELESAGRIAEPGQDWSAEDCALAFLRVLAPNVPLDEFIDSIANAKPTANIMIEDGCAAQTAQGEQIADYKDSSLVRDLSEYVRAVALDVDQAGRPAVLLGVTTYQAASGYCSAVSVRYEKHGLQAAATVTLLYGDVDIFGPPVRGRVLGLGPEALDALGRAMKGEAIERSTLPGAPVERTTQSGETLH